MRHRKTISRPWTLFAALVMAAVFAAAFPRLQDWHDWLSYTHFVRHDRLYFKCLAGDCNSLLRTHPVGSAGLATDDRAPGWFRVNLSGTSLPESISRLHPNCILVCTNKLFVSCGTAGRLGWDFMWEQFSDDRTNTWALIAEVPYKCERPLYVERK